MTAFLSALSVALVAWRVAGFVAAYRRAKIQKANDLAEREQKKDWARRMQGRSEQGK